MHAFPMDAEMSSLIVLYNATRSRFPPQRVTQQCASVFYATHRCESEDRSLKAPSGIRDMSLPWRDLRER